MRALASAAGVTVLSFPGSIARLRGHPEAALDFSFAFQPIVELPSGDVFAYEALLRGSKGEPANQVFERFLTLDPVLFDVACRARAVAVAAQVGIDARLSLNFPPSAALTAAGGLCSTLAEAQRFSFAPQRIIIEVTESDAVADPAGFASIMNEYRRAGVTLAIDDFGAGYAGLSLLAEFQPDIVKLDQGLARSIPSHGPRQAIVRAILQVCFDLGIDVVIEGIETLDEYRWFADEGVSLFQGYLFARPEFEGLPSIYLPDR